MYSPVMSKYRVTSRFVLQKLQLRRTPARRHNMDVRELFRNLKKEAECPLCLETVNEPKTLPCLHSFCLLCLDKHAAYARRQLQTTIKCPVCLTCFPIPEGDTFGGLPASFHLNRLVDVLALGDQTPQSQACSSCEENNTATCYCFDCSDFFCNACAKVHNQMKISRHHRSVLIQNLKTQDIEEMMHRPVMCGEKYHEKETLEYYCQDCEVCACQKCVILNHNRHAMADMQEAAEERKMQITEVVEEAKTKINHFEKEIVQEIALLNKSREDTEAARNKVRTTIEELVRILKEHERAMVAKFDEIDEERQRCHAIQQERQLFVTQLKSSAEYCEAVLQRDLSFEILQVQQTVVERCKTLLNEESEVNVKKPLNVNYVTNEKLVEDVRRAVFGQVLVSYSDSSQSVADGKGLEEAEVGIEANFIVTTKDFEGKQCYYENDLLEITIKSLSGTDVVDKVIKDNKDGEYTVAYTLHCADEHTVVIMLNGKHLTGSPWCILVSPHQYKSAFRFGPRSIGWDANIAFSEMTETIAVADHKNWRVQLFSSSGKFIAKFDFECFNAFGKPYSVAFTRSGEILVVRAHSISLFTEELQFIKHITNDQVKNPWKLSVAQDGRMIVTDIDDKAIKVLSHDGAEVLLSFTAPDCELSPGFAVYHQGMFFVCFPHCIKVFNEEGAFLYDIGSDGTGDGQLGYPCGLAIDKFNSLIVCDPDNKRLQVFTLDGKFLNSIDQNEPLSIAASSSGFLFVANNWKGTHVDALH